MDISKGCQQSISQLSEEQQKSIIQLTREYGRYLVQNGGDIHPGLGYWEETIEYVEQTKIEDVRRLLRSLKRKIKDI